MFRDKWYSRSWTTVKRNVSALSFYGTVNKKTLIKYVLSFLDLRYTHQLPWCHPVCSWPNPPPHEQRSAPCGSCLIHSTPHEPTENPLPPVLLRYPWVVLQSNIWCLHWLVQWYAWGPVPNDTEGQRTEDGGIIPNWNGKHINLSRIILSFGTTPLCAVYSDEIQWSIFCFVLAKAKFLPNPVICYLYYVISKEIHLGIFWFCHSRSKCCCIFCKCIHKRLKNHL